MTVPCRCDHCGTVLDDRMFGAALLAMRVTPKQAAILRRLIAAQGAVVPLEGLIHAVYSNRPDGGPNWADRATKHGIYMLKHKARRQGWDIVNVRGFGYRLEKRDVIELRPRRAA